MSDLTTLSMTEAADAFARGEVTANRWCAPASPGSLRMDGKVNAVIRLDGEAALEAAAAQDKARASGAVPGRLAGAPMMHKDMYYRAGKVSTCGSKIRRDFVAHGHRDRAAAAGRRRRDRHGHAEHGGVRAEPDRPQRAFRPLPQSLGPGLLHRRLILGFGAGVAARFFTAALGSDTGGSIRLPATLCGVTGLKATQTRVSRAGVMPLSFSADNVGPLVRTARDAAASSGSPRATTPGIRPARRSRCRITRRR